MNNKESFIKELVHTIKSKPNRFSLVFKDPEIVTDTLKTKIGDLKFVDNCSKLEENSDNLINFSIKVGDPRIICCWDDLSKLRTRDFWNERLASKKEEKVNFISAEQGLHIMFSEIDPSHVFYEDEDGRGFCDPKYLP